MEELELYIEALLFASAEALKLDEICQALEDCFDQNFSKDDVQSHVNNIIIKYETSPMAMQVINVAGGYQFMTKKKYHSLVMSFLKLKEKKRLSRAALETLSIIAYKQPVTKSQMEGIRGVNCDYSVQKLLDRELVEIKGRDEGPGRPLLYGTTVKFLNHFGINDTTQLPKLKEFETVENSIGREEE